MRVPALQLAFVAALRTAQPDWQIEEEAAPDWLVRPGRAECGPRWDFLCEAYGELTGLVLPDIMPVRERRRLDAVIVGRAGGPPRVLEIDEKQHFSGPRAATLALYDDSVPVAFDVATWLDLSRRRASREPGGGFARPCPPLFPGPGGRHKQRAFRDLLADVLPPTRGWWPTIRVSDDEVKRVLSADDSPTAALSLLTTKIALA